MNKIAQLLTELGLEKYLPVFDEAEIEFEDLPDLSEADFVELGLPMGPRRRLTRAIKAPSPEPDNTANVQTDVIPTTADTKPTSHAE